MLEIRSFLAPKILAIANAYFPVSPVAHIINTASPCTILARHANGNHAPIAGFTKAATILSLSDAGILTIIDVGAYSAIAPNSLDVVWK